MVLNNKMMLIMIKMIKIKKICYHKSLENIIKMILDFNF